MECGAHSFGHAVIVGHQHWHNRFTQPKWVVKRKQIKRSKTVRHYRHFRFTTMLCLAYYRCNRLAQSSVNQNQSPFWQMRVIAKRSTRILQKDLRRQFSITKSTGQPPDCALRLSGLGERLNRVFDPDTPGQPVRRCVSKYVFD